MSKIWTTQSCGCKQLCWFIFCKQCLCISYWFWTQPHNENTQCLQLPCPSLRLLSYSSGRVSALWKDHFSTTSRDRTSRRITYSPIQLSWKQNIPESWVAQCFQIRYFYICLSFGIQSGTHRTEKNNKLDQNTATLCLLQVFQRKKTRPIY